MPSVEVTVESIAAGGDGVARADGFVVFIPRSAPGDSGTVTIQRAGRFARAEFDRLTQESPRRVSPPCMHYTRDRCGGCQLQHLAYPAQLEAKARIVRDALERIGRSREAGSGKREAESAARLSPPASRFPLPDIHPSPLEWRYRRKLTLMMRRRGKSWVAGLHPFDSPNRIFALEDCPITDRRVLEVWREVMSAAEHLPEARELRGAVRVDEGAATFVLQGALTWPGSLEFFEALPSLTSLWWEPHGAVRRMIHARSAADMPGASFSQVNAAMAPLLERHVLERIVSYAPLTVVDAYSGTGNSAAALAAGGVRVTAIEVDPDASEWCARRLPAGSRAIAAKVEDALPDALPADVVLLNPPRSGVALRVTESLETVRVRPRAIVYVSCDPATLARDVSRLPSYRVASLMGFDMFPQTAHVETVCELVPFER